MSLAPKLSGPRRPAASGQTRKLVVLLHGYGADGEDLIGLTPYLARAMPDAAFVAPHAPEPCEGAPMGRQWWAIRSFNAEERLRGALRAAPLLDRFLDDELQRLRLAPADLALVGFSQGTMMALHVGLRRERAVAAIVGFSGALVAPETLAQEARSKPPILLVHGDMDDLLPIDSLFDAAQGLAAAEIPAQWHISQGVGHSIGQDGMALAADFLARALSGRL